MAILAVGVVAFANTYYRNNDNYVKFLLAQDASRRAATQPVSNRDLAGNFKKLAARARGKSHLASMLIAPQQAVSVKPRPDITNITNSHWYGREAAKL